MISFNFENKVKKYQRILRLCSPSFKNCQHVGGHLCLVGATLAQHYLSRASCWFKRNNKNRGWNWNWGCWDYFQNYSFNEVSRLIMRSQLPVFALHSFIWPRISGISPAEFIISSPAPWIAIVFTLRWFIVPLIRLLCFLLYDVVQFTPHNKAGKVLLQAEKLS